jgi:hypothetical protein
LLSLDSKQLYQGCQHGILGNSVHAFMPEAAGAACL